MTKWIFCIMTLSGCSALQPYAQIGAKAEDDALSAAEFTQCYAASIGAIRRKYGTDPIKASAWATLCADKSTEVLPTMIKP